MITESFINSCFSIVINKTIKIKKNKQLYRDVLSILNFYENKEKLEIPLSVKTKFECLKKICQMKMDDKTTQNAIDSLLHSQKFINLHDFLEHKRNEEVNDQAAVDNVKQIRLRKKLNSLVSNYDELSKFLDQLKDGSFDCIDDLVLDYEEIIKKLYSNMMEENRGVAIEASASLDLVEDEYDHVLELIVKKYERTNTIPTGFSVFDNEVLNGGAEPSRIYVIAGSSGAGKSTFLNNLIVNSATQNINVFDKDENTEIKKSDVESVFVYITLENTIEESLMRLYQAMFFKDKNDVLRDISNGVNIKGQILERLRACKSTVIMKYFPAMSISSLDIMAVMDDVIAEYGKGVIKGLYVDYLDLLKTDVKYDMYRLELGHIILSLKTLAVQYNVPVFVPTQLGRSSYRVQGAGELNLDQISESVKKIEHADFVILMTRDQVDQTKIFGKIGKNRSGKSNINIEFKVDFEKFKFINAKKVMNDNKNDSLKRPGEIPGDLPDHMKIEINNNPTSTFTQPSSSISQFLNMPGGI